MVRRAFFSFALAAATLIACAGPQPGTTTTTGGTVSPAHCALTSAPCERDSDCCSLWCVNGLCTRRQP
jgi:hypothetical protein